MTAPLEWFKIYIIIEYAPKSANKTQEKEIMIKNKYSLPYDYCANFVVKSLLKKRNAKEIYSSAEKSEKYLSSLTQEKQDGYRVPEYIKFKNKSETLSLGGFPLIRMTPDGQTECRKAVIYLHGGAFVNQPDDRHYRIPDDLSTYSGAEVNFFIYPKAPSHTYKEAYALTEKLYLELSEKYGSENITLMGDSAGATMSICLCEVFRKKNIPLPSQLILYSPVTEMRLSHPDIEKIFPHDPMQGVDGLKLFAKAWAGEADILSPLLNPVETDLSLLPKTTIFAGTTEIFNPELREFVRKCKKAGSDVSLYQYKGMYHCFVLFDLLAARFTKKKSGKLIRES